MCLGLALVVIGAIWLAMYPGALGMSLVVLIVGVVIIAICFMGILGSGYDGAGKSCRFGFLAVFFLATLIVGAVLIVIGVICIFSRKVFESGYILNWSEHQEQMENTLKKIDKPDKSFSDALERDMTQLFILGVIIVIIGVFVLIGFLASGGVMGMTKFLQTTISLGSILIAVVGALVLIVCIVLYATEPIVKDQLGIFIGGIVVGALLIVFGIYGCISTCCAHKTKWLIRIWAILILILDIAILVVAILCFALKNGVMDGIQSTTSKNCNVKDELTVLNESTCSKQINNIIQYMCNGTLYSTVDDFPSDPTKWQMIPNCVYSPLNPTGCLCIGTSFRAGKSSYEFIYPYIEPHLMTQAEGSIISFGVIALIVFVIVLFFTVVGFIQGCCSKDTESSKQSQVVSVSVSVDQSYEREEQS
eukprot:MONOS_10750.1-p1 / transcript=MONOS_10750.1 / gene=MONOS_10750 / organism=Monocercomonoides_exilis_PA203 / gene_product=unspecified product / transcript_product=unspecified product / location=Mono_scaffold00502:837-2153(+) / protein_length=418 / sequence_SO=supercontig / SO=protein_coding / is_pseudo=false